VTAGRGRGHPVRMRVARYAAAASGGAGLVAILLLVLFFALARPFDDEVTAYSWLGPANDVAVVVQFAALVPVPAALSRRLPATRGVRVATVAAMVAAAAVVVFQALLVAGLLDFGVQVLLVSASFLVVFGWIVAVSSAGHRTGLLPRQVTRFGLLVGASYPVGVAIAAPALLFAGGSAARYAFLVPGLLIGAVGWLAMPVWPLLLARLVFGAAAGAHVPNRQLSPEGRTR
jgi:hypothetical protein